ncbi:MAG: dockerin type I domain-containing protein, partial [Planctomycetota bacterium]
IILEIQATTFGLNATLDSIGVVGGSSNTTNFGNVLGSGELSINVLVNGLDSVTLGTPPEFIEGANAVHTYFVTNPGTLGVNDVIVTDDAGTPGDLSDDISPLFTGGDANGDNVLDPGETWTYRSTRTIVSGTYAAIATVTGVDGPDNLSATAETSHVGVELSTFYGWHNADLAADINDDGSISPIDALTLINELTDRVYSNEESSVLVPFDATAEALFDVNNDGYASPLDAVLAIRALDSVVDAPVLDLSGSGVDGNNGNVTLGIGEFSVLLAPDAEIRNLSRSVLNSMTITITNPIDGLSEAIIADTAFTAIEAIFVNSDQTGDGTARLSLVGYERMETYISVLNSLLYVNTSVAPAAADRIIEVVVNDGFSDSDIQSIRLNVANS